ncbi:prepilin peptidase [Paraburkholderia sp. UCT31]|uniref:prepilin peptidase n=1 Tax=Paraburkholderia sp. UCT31 TaxID=2615209 RepID=UPI0016551987|nr:A24 family peptidase [Paraburkholderia sp. UCT31]MBC8737279.1 prepilin peptidase [Paraburkholderia sp. UCT31]
MYALISFVFGLLFGSYGNSVVHRLPRRMHADWEAEARDVLGQPARTDADTTLVSKRSHCPHCKATIAWYDNLPLLSWLVLRAKCRMCSAPISARYFVLELAGGLIGLGAYDLYGFTVAALALGTAGLMLLYLSAIDIEHQLLPDVLVFPLLWVGLFAATQGWTVRPAESIEGALFGYLLLATPAWIFKLIRHKEGMGGGDLKLLMALGAFLGIAGVVGTLLVASVAAVVIHLGLIAAKKAHWQSRTPFGPFLVAGGVVSFVTIHFDWLRLPAF